MEQIYLIYILLGLIVLILSAAFIRLGSILIHLQTSQRINNAYNDDHYRQRDEAYQRQDEMLEDLTQNIQQLKSDIEDIKYVCDVFYKYKLPAKNEREMLDKITIDNEIFDGIASENKS